MKVLWVDPGLKSGVALFNTETLKAELLLIIPNGLTGFQEWVEFGEVPEHDVLGCESFEMEEGTHGVDLTPVEIIGYLKGLGMDVVWQRRNQRGKGKLISVPVLKRAGLYPARGELKEGHQVAALQHALRYLVGIRNLKVIRLLHPPQE